LAQVLTARVDLRLLRCVAKMSTPTITSLTSVEEVTTDAGGDYEEERVPDHALQENITFATVFGGRHTAAPELVIGPQFVLGGATFADMMVGCFIGNLLAVLAWRYVCAPIAVLKRFSTYYTVKRICGNSLLAVYNLLVALVLGAIAGFMYILATNALAIGFGLDVSGNGFFITDPAQIFITLLTGSFTTVVAMFGFKFVTVVSNFLTPPMFIIIGYLIYAAFDDLGIGFSNFSEKMSSVVFTGEARPGKTVFTLVVVICTAFAQDQFAHIGLIDLTLFRFAKDEAVGWQSAWGMYLGHFFLWIGAGVLFRSQEIFTGSDDIIPGPMAYRLAGWPGLLAILFASWSTANPFLYAGGLALKSSLTIRGVDTSEKTVIGVTGVIATVVAFAPGVVGFFLLFVQLGGCLLVPVGAIVVGDTYLLPRLGLASDYSFKQSADCSAMNRPAALAWWVGSGLTAPLMYFGILPGHYAFFISFPLSIAIYTFESQRVRRG